MQLAILNTSILTAYGSYAYEPLDLEEAFFYVKEREVWGEKLLSAIGHESTAKILSTLLGIEVPVSRIVFCQEKGQKAIVFKLRGHPPEGKILSAEEVEAIGYDFGLLTRLP